MTLLGPLLMLFSVLPTQQASAFFCFGPDMITATMCIAQKGSAIAIMTKLEHDPRAGSWASEGQPGVNFVKREEKAMALASSCLDLISCTAANAMAWSVMGSIPSPVKGDLGDFAGQIWYGAQLPPAGQSLDQLFDNKDPSPPFYARSTPFFDQQGSSDLLGSSPPAGGRTISVPGEASSTLAAEVGGTVSSSPTSGTTLARRPASGVPTSGLSGAAAAAAGDSQAPSPIRYDGQGALDLSQTSNFAPYGGSGGQQVSDPDEIVGFMTSQAGDAPLLFSANGVHEGRRDGYSQASDSGQTMTQDGSSDGGGAGLLDAPNDK